MATRRLTSARLYCLLQMVSPLQTGLSGVGSSAKAAAPHACGVCGKRFAAPAWLQRHMLTHTGERPFHCMYCQNSFNRKSNLKQHVDRMHRRWLPAGDFSEPPGPDDGDMQQHAGTSHPGDGQQNQSY